jgi:hypothetical protein
LDYLAPQLYWPIARPDQSFPVLYDWWLSVNTKKRHIWPGLATYRVAENSQRHIPAQEIVDEIDTTRVRGGDLGHIHFNASALMKNPDSLDEKLSVRYANPALVPASPWLGARPPGRPTVIAGRDAATDEAVVRFAPRKGEVAWLWALRTSRGGVWTNEVLPGWLRSHELIGQAPDSVIVSAVSRTGIEGERATARWKKSAVGANARK